jgi:hypothetical protein
VRNYNDLDGSKNPGVIPVGIENKCLFAGVSQI